MIIISDIKKMSLVEFLQQTVMRDVSHQILQQIQTVHTATEQLLDNISELRQLNKQQVVENKINIVRQYIEIKQDILQALNGFQHQSFQNWVSKVLNKTPIVGQLVRMHRSQVQNMIIKLIKSIFVLDRSSHEEADEQKTLNQISQKLRTLKECEASRNKPNRTLIQQISRLDEKFLHFYHKFQERIEKFNEAVQIYVVKLQKYEQTVREQFYAMVINNNDVQLKEENVDKQNNQEDTPYKDLGYEKQLADDLVSNSTKSGLYRNNIYGTRVNNFWRQSQRRDPYYGTM